jgi:hypothetical protein
MRSGWGGGGSVTTRLDLVARVARLEGVVDVALVGLEDELGGRGVLGRLGALHPAGPRSTPPPSRCGAVRCGSACLVVPSCHVWARGLGTGARESERGKGQDGAAVTTAKTMKREFGLSPLSLHTDCGGE